MNKTIDKIEIISVHLQETDTDLTVIYRPPQIDFQTLKTVLKNNVINRKKSHILIGDFNINIAERNRTTREYYNMFKERNYKIMNSKRHCTRINPNGLDSILDHVITNNREKIAKIKIIPTNLSDHNAVTLQINKTTKRRHKYELLELSITDYKQISTNIQNLKPSSITSLEDLSKSIQRIIETNQKNIKIRRRKDCPWINENIVTNIKKRNKLFQRLKRHPLNDTYKLEYKTQKDYTNRLVKNTKVQYFQTLIKKYHTDSRKIWELINNQLNKKQKPNSDITKIMKEDGTTTTDPKEISNELNKYFATVGKNLAQSQINNSNRTPQTTVTQKNIPQIYFEDSTPEEIIEIIKALKDHKAPGFDKITNELLKQNKDKLANIISTLINKTLHDGTYPDYLKQTIIVPIHKKHEKSNPANYRPISMLSAINKILEKVIYQRILTHIQKNDIIYYNQYAFQPQTSTMSAAYDLTTDIKNELDQKKTVIVLYIDMRKAFDTISKHKLIEKLSYYGFKDKELNIIKTYIYNREQRTRVNNIISEPMYAEYGIPQGGNLPPILYTLYVNDLLEQPLHGKIYAYADDTCILYSGDITNNIENKIEKDIQLLEEWCFNNLLTINETKTEYMIYSNKKKRPHINIYLKNQKLTEVSETIYLGLHMQNTMKWDTHIQKLTEENIKTIAALHKIKTIIPPSFKKPIYHSLFTAKNSYLIQIWGNTTQKNLSKIQRQQNKILKILYKMHYRTPTTDIYKKTHELTIQKLITLHNLLLLHKIQNKKIKLKTKLHTNRQIHDHKTRRVSHLRSERYRHKHCSQILTTKAIEEYNKIPKNVKQLPHHQFKKHIKRVLNEKTN